MTHEIKAQDLKPGMKIEWTQYGWTHSGTVSEVNEPNRSSLFIAFRAAGELWMYVEKDLKVTVLKEAQPEEPTAFGARVVVDGVQFIRRGGGSTYAWEASFGTCFTWDDLLRLGHVTVIPDQGWTDPAGSEATPEVHVATEPRVWERWADVPEMTPVLASGIIPPYRKVGDRIECKRGGSWGPTFAGEYDLNKFSPLTEVLDA